MTNPLTKGRAQSLCAYLVVPFTPADVYEAMTYNDTLAFGMARLFYWPDPDPLPKAGDAQASWAYYQRTWRPGKPRPETWPGYTQLAVAALPA